MLTCWADFCTLDLDHLGASLCSYDLTIDGPRAALGPTTGEDIVCICLTRAGACAYVCMYIYTHTHLPLPTPASQQLPEPLGYRGSSSKAQEAWMKEAWPFFPYQMPSHSPPSGSQAGLSLLAGIRSPLNVFRGLAKSLTRGRAFYLSMGAPQYSVKTCGLDTGRSCKGDDLPRQSMELEGTYLP